MWKAVEGGCMSADSEKDTSRAVVKTYLPEYQREQWDAHAEELDMSRSEFVKTMVQAGRRGFDGATEPERSDESVDQSSDEQTVVRQDSTLDETVLDALSTDEYLSWDGLLAAVTDDIESRLEETLQELQADDEVRYSGRHGGYTLES